MLKKKRKTISAEGICHAREQKIPCTNGLPCRVTETVGSIANEGRVVSLNYIIGAFTHLNGKKIRVTIEVLDE